MEEHGCPRVVWDGSELDWVDPGGRRLYLRGVGREFLEGWPFDQAYERLLREYRPSRRYRLGLFMPCSYGKPYSQSYIHYLIRRAIAPWLREGLVHEIIVTNAGVVPRELDEYWPFTAYDWNPLRETPEIRQCYRDVLARRVRGYIERFHSHYHRFTAYLRWDSDSWAAIERVREELGLAIPNLAPRAVPQREVEDAGLGLGYEKDPDIVLITPTALRSLREGLRTILERGEP